MIRNLLKGWRAVRADPPGPVAAAKIATRPKAKARDKPEKEKPDYLKYRGGNRGVSREFLQQAARGEEIFCQLPWRRLDVVLDGNRTKVCCSFPIRLPRFDWPTMETFHDETQMWNHPFMQRMRAGMRNPDEVPVCTLCQDDNKRARNNTQAHRDACDATRTLYHQIEDAHYRDTYRGAVDRLETDASPSPTLAREMDLTAPLSDYRRMVRQRHCYNSGRVLQIGLATPRLAPFLAEANPHLHIADFAAAPLERATALLHQFNLDAAHHILPAAGALPLETASFDAVWLDGFHLHAAHRRHLLAELRRILVPGGVLHIRRAFGPGEVLLRAASAQADIPPIPAEDTFHGDTLFADRLPRMIAPAHTAAPGVWACNAARIARTSLTAGERAEDVGNFLTRDGVRRTLRLSGFTVDQSVKPLFTPLGSAAASRAHYNKRLPGFDLDGFLAQHVSGTVEPDASGLDRFLTFSAMADGADRKFTHNKAAPTRRQT